MQEKLEVRDFFSKDTYFQTFKKKAALSLKDIK